MDGSPPDMLGGLSSLTLEEVSGIREACPFPCNRDCAARECTIVLPKDMRVTIRFDESKKCHYFELSSGDNMKVDLSIDNLVRTLSKCANVEEVIIQNRYDMGKEVEVGDGNEALKALCKSLETLSSLRSLAVWDVVLFPLSVEDAKVVFKVLEVHKSLHVFNIFLGSESPIQALVAKLLVDSLLQNTTLHQVMVYVSKSLSDENVQESNGVVRELGRYMKASTNVLTKLITCFWSGDELDQLMDYLNDNKQLQVLYLCDMRGDYSGVVMKMGEMLRNNSGIKEFGILRSSMTGKEFKH